MVTPIEEEEQTKEQVDTKVQIVTENQLVLYKLDEIISLLTQK